MEIILGLQSNYSPPVYYSGCPSILIVDPVGRLPGDANPLTIGWKKEDEQHL